MNKYLMKKIIFTSIILLLLASCWLSKSTKSVKITHLPDKDPITTESPKPKNTDSLVKVILTDAYYTGDMLEMSPDELIWSGRGNPKLKVKTIVNTKVIRKNSDLSGGRVVYKIPQQMVIGSISHVVLRIAKSRTTISVFDDLEGTVMTSEIPVSQTMEVKLIDPSASTNKYFDIIPDNDGVQLIEDDSTTYTEWSWNVTPIRAGNSSLKIVVSVIRDGNKKEVVYEDSIEIQKNLKFQLLTFWQKYWQWIIGTLLSPFAVWLYQNRRKKKKTSPKRKPKQ